MTLLSETTEALQKVSRRIIKLETIARELRDALESILCVVCDEPGDGEAAILGEKDPIISCARTTIRKVAGRI